MFVISLILNSKNLVMLFACYHRFALDGDAAKSDDESHVDASDASDEGWLLNLC